MPKKLTEKEKLRYAKADLGYYLKQERTVFSIKQLAIAKAYCRLLHRADMLKTKKRYKILELYDEKKIAKKFVKRALVHSVAYAKKRFDEVIDETKSVSSNKSKVLYLALLHDLAPISAVEIAFQKYKNNARLKNLHYTKIKPLQEWKEVIDTEIERIKKKLEASKEKEMEKEIEILEE